jgi:hypothetical protein
MPSIPYTAAHQPHAAQAERTTETDPFQQAEIVRESTVVDTFSDLSITADPLWPEYGVVLYLNWID